MKIELESRAEEAGTGASASRTPNAQFEWHGQGVWQRPAIIQHVCSDGLSTGGTRGRDRTTLAWGQQVHSKTWSWKTVIVKQEKTRFIASKACVCIGIWKNRTIRRFKVHLLMYVALMNSEHCDFMGLW